MDYHTSGLQLPCPEHVRNGMPVQNNQTDKPKFKINTLQSLVSFSWDSHNSESTCLWGGSKLRWAKSVLCLTNIWRYVAHSYCSCSSQSGPPSYE